MTLMQLLQILRARRGSIVLTAVIFAILGAVISIFIPRSYLGEVSMVADVKDTDPVTGTLVHAQVLNNFLNTQADIIRSRAVAMKVVDKLRLADDRRLQAQFQDATGGVGGLKEWIADRLTSNIEVEFIKSSNVFNIIYSSPDGGDAALFANAFADAYIQTTIDLRMDPARRQAGWFDEQLLDLRKSLEKAQAKLSDYQRANSLVTTDGRLDEETA